MNLINDYIMKNLAGDPNVESQFKHIVCGDAAVDEANQELVRSNILTTREQQFKKEHDDWANNVGGGEHYA